MFNLTPKSHCTFNGWLIKEFEVHTFYTADTPKNQVTLKNNSELYFFKYNSIWYVYIVSYITLEYKYNVCYIYMYPDKRLNLITSNIKIIKDE